MKKTENRWICVQENHRFPFFDNSSLDWTRRDSIKKFIEGSKFNWNYWSKEIGWKCVKVKVTIETI